jgi:hypothetical protein
MQNSYCDPRNFDNVNQPLGKWAFVNMYKLKPPAYQPWRACSQVINKSALASTYVWLFLLAEVEM